MTNVKMVMMFVVTLCAGVAEARGGDGPGPIQIGAATGGYMGDNKEFLTLDLNLAVRLKSGRLGPAKNDWTIAFTLGSQAQLGVRPDYRFEALSLGLDVKWQMGMVFGWRFVNRTIFGRDSTTGFFTGPNLTFGRYNYFEFDIAVLGGKFLDQYGGWTGWSNGHGTAMVKFDFRFGPAF